MQLSISISIITTVLDIGDAWKACNNKISKNHLRKAKLIITTLRKAKLRNANLRNAHLRKANAKKCKAKICKATNCKAEICKAKKCKAKKCNAKVRCVYGGASLCDGCVPSVPGNRRLDCDCEAGCCGVIDSEATASSDEGAATGHVASFH